MSKKNALLEQAIADAKAVVESSAEYGKISFQEAFAPKLQRMISRKLEQDEMGDEEDLPVEQDEFMDDEIPMEPEEEFSDEEELPMEQDEFGDEEDDMELESILRELDDEEFSDEEELPMESDEFGDEEEELPMESDEFGDEEDDMELEALVRELEDEYSDEEELPMEQDEFGDEEEELPMESFRRRNVRRQVNSGMPVKRENVKLKRDLKEAYDVIQLMRKKFNEVNLLNSKLLYSSKLFRTHNLNEKQKVAVLESFDRANSVREVKLLYSTLSVNFKKGDNKRKNIRESFSSDVVANKSRIGNTVITDSSTAVNRLKQLAGLAETYK